MNTEVVLSVIATILALFAFCRELWRTWRDRPLLNFYISRQIFRNLPQFDNLEMIKILICNVGYRPIILVRFRAFGEKSAFSMGIHDEPSAIFGIPDRRFPALIEPGGVLEIHPLEVAALERNYTDPKDEKVFFDPWKYFVVEDGFGHFHPIDVGEVRRELGLAKTWRRLKGLRKFKDRLIGRRLLYHARRRFN